MPSQTTSQVTTVPAVIAGEPVSATPRRRLRGVLRAAGATLLVGALIALTVLSLSHMRPVAPPSQPAPAQKSQGAPPHLSPGAPTSGIATPITH